MGADKFENEDLIRYGLPEDIWFHVDNISSAHVYLRLNKNERVEDVATSLIHECAQLVKANSIEGCKLKEVTVIYTRWRNLKKTSDMEIGAIGFHDRSKVKSIKIQKDVAAVKELNKTKITEFPNLQGLQEARAIEYRNEMKAMKREALSEEKRKRKEDAEIVRLRTYETIMQPGNMKANSEFESTVDDRAAKDFEDDFM